MFPGEAVARSDYRGFALVPVVVVRPVEQQIDVAGQQPSNVATAHAMHLEIVSHCGDPGNNILGTDIWVHGLKIHSVRAVW